MVYIRSKRVKGTEYAYLVKSEWNAGEKISKQQIIKYLGKSSNVELEDIPMQYRQNPKILSFLSEHSPRNRNKKRALTEDLSKKLYQSLSSGDVENATRIYEGSRNILCLEEFYDRILKPVMYDVGAKWEKSEIDVATEHVCTNTAYALVAAINERISKSDNREKILLCSPDGELHSLSASVLESILRGRGYRVFNATPSIPTDSIINFIRNTEPNLIMVSITLLDNIKAGERLVNRIRSEFLIPILIGGLAILSKNGNFQNAITANPQENSIEDMLRLVRSSLKKKRTMESIS
ncbi:MAG: cobalamin B12-binding domain-containing protein [Thermoproteota archaeon]|nr:cobalamin B12-binding domain-containing protein [Thermoproteota archaeon]